MIIMFTAKSIYNEEIKRSTDFYKLLKLIMLVNYSKVINDVGAKTQ